jgi:hypothetical protein
VILCSQVEVYRRFGWTFPWGFCTFVPDCTALHRRFLKHSLGCGNTNAHKINYAFAYRVSFSLTFATSTHYYISRFRCFLNTLLFLYSFAFHCFCFSVWKLVLSLSLQLTSSPLPPPSTLCHLQPPETAPSLRLPNLPECFSALGLSWVIPRKTCSSNIAAAEMDGQRKYTLPTFPLLHTR